MIVWLIEERCWGEMFQYGAFYSLIEYECDGEKILEWVSNDDWEDRFGYEPD